MKAICSINTKRIPTFGVDSTSHFKSSRHHIIAGLVILLLIGCSTMFADNTPVTPPANPVPIFKIPMPVPKTHTGNDMQ